MRQLHPIRPPGPRKKEGHFRDLLDFRLFGVSSAINSAGLRLRLRLGHHRNRLYHHRHHDLVGVWLR